MNIDDVSELAGGEMHEGYKCRAPRVFSGASKGQYCDGRMRLTTDRDVGVLQCTRCERIAQIERDGAEEDRVPRPDGGADI